MISRDPTLWYATVEIDKGSDDGVHRGDPVTADGALVGEVTTVDPTVSVVTLITDHTMAVAAQVSDSSGDTGVLVPAVGNPNQLQLQYLPTSAPVQTGQQVVTVGFKSGPLQDLYPPGIPIGQVASVGNSLANNGEVPVTPAADLRHFTIVQVLTAPHARHRAGPGADRGQDRMSESLRLPIRLALLGARDRDHPGGGGLADLDLRDQRRPDGAGRDVRSGCSRARSPGRSWASASGCWSTWCSYRRSA